MSFERILGIHLVPSPVVRRTIRGGRKFTARYAGSQDLEPHVTLYLARFTSQSFHRLIKAFIQHPPPRCTVRFSSIHAERLEDGRWFLSLGVRRTPSLVRLHTVVVKTANTFRQGLVRRRDTDRIRQSVYSKKEIVTIKRYGYRRVMDKFVPHLTVGVVSERALLKTRTALRAQFRSLRQYTWEPNDMTVGLYRYDTRREQYSGKSEEQSIQLRDRRRAKSSGSEK